MVHWNNDFESWLDDMRVHTSMKIHTHRMAVVASYDHHKMMVMNNTQNKAALWNKKNLEQMMT